MSLQISAYVSDETKNDMEHYSAIYGVKKGYIIENAIEHYLQALHEIPQEFIVPAKMTLSDESFEKLVQSAENPQKPTDMLKGLMGGD